MRPSLTCPAAASHMDAKTTCCSSAGEVSWLLRPDGVVNPYNHKSYRDTYDFRVGCDLNYNVNGPSAFIFNMSEVNNSFQRILTEAFTTEPQLQIEESRSPIEEKRLHRLSAGAGPLRVQYSATVELSHYVQPAESVRETPPGALPAAVVPYLYPSRYCEADILVRLAQHEFGKLQPGFSRVTAICNWIHDNVEYLRGSTNRTFSTRGYGGRRRGIKWRSWSKGLHYMGCGGVSDGGCLLR